MGKRRSVSAPIVIAGLVAFIIVDLALVFFALRAPTQTSSNPAPPTSIPANTSPSAFTPTPTATPEPAPASMSPTSTATAPTAAPSATSSTLQGFAGSQVGFRATAGSCTGPDSVIELTKDGGTTWTNVTPTDIRIREVDSIVVVDQDHVDLLARYGDSCTLSDVSTYTQGEFWQVYPDRTAQFGN